MTTQSSAEGRVAVSGSRRSKTAALVRLDRPQPGAQSGLLLGSAFNLSTRPLVTSACYAPRFVSTSEGASMETVSSAIPARQPWPAIIGWVLFDPAAHPFFALVTTFVFAPY